METYNLMALIQPDGTLALNPQGSSPVTININTSPDGSKNAIIAFGGSNQACVSFDAMGTTPVSYQMFHAFPDYIMEQSVRNILSEAFKG